MTFDAVLTVARPRARQTICAILLGAATVTPAVAEEQVYVWRDGSGVVRFSAVDRPPEATDADARAEPPQHETGDRPSAGSSRRAAPPLS